MSLSRIRELFLSEVSIMPRKSNTRAAQGGGTIRQRKDGRWEARFTVGRDPGTGKQIQKSIYGKTQQEVRQRLQQATLSIDMGVYTEPTKLTVSGWLDIWLKEFLSDVKPRTQELYRSTVKNRIKPALGAVKLCELKPAAIQKFYNDCGRGDSPLAPKTIKNLHGIVHKALQQAVEVGYLRENPADACKTPRVTKKEITPFDEEETKLFVKAVCGDTYEMLFLVTLFTGMREGEVLGLKWDAVDFDVGMIRIVQQLQLHKGVYQIMPTKNGKPRTITPAPYVMNLLRKQKRIQSEWRLAAGSAWQDDDFVFSNQFGAHLARQTVYKHFKDAVTSIGLMERRFHDLRHTYAVASLRAGDDPKTVSENLGHATVAFTLDIYGHVTDQMRRASADRMQAYIDGLTL